MRNDNRKKDQMRTVKITNQYLMSPQGSVLIEMGNTKVICTASVEETTARHLKGTGQGWVTAEYGMLPGSTGTRKRRDVLKTDGRTVEIQRLIGRALRSVVDLSLLGERTIWIDCDVIQADGGTRTASITGAYVALVDALKWMKNQGMIREWPLKSAVSAISVGIVEGEARLDLAYEEDFAATVDMNLVMTDQGEFVEIQGTGEEATFTAAQLQELLALGEKGCRELFRKQKEATMIKIVAASQNKHKIKEIEAITAQFGMFILPRDEAGVPDFEIEEDQDTFEGNSYKKALEIMKQCGEITIADDSGLEVDVLDGAPGVFSARFAGDACDDEANNRKLLEMLKEVPAEKRTGRFVSVITMVFPDGRSLSARGEVEGHIAFEKRGENGFGYDPLFIPLGHDRTFGEFPPEEKNTISHRANALIRLRELLCQENEQWISSF
jgi:ribonuclease PH